MAGTVSLNVLQLKNYYAVERAPISPPLQAIRAQFNAQLVCTYKWLFFSFPNFSFSSGEFRYLIDDNYWGSASSPFYYFPVHRNPA
jgi:hypothetical protein